MALRADQLPALDRLLARMLALPAAEQAAWVDALQGEDAALAPSLRDLLAQPGLLDGVTPGDAAGDAWSTPLRGAIADAVLATPAFCAGQAVGPYRLLSPLGEGGMGVVWLAERADGTLRRQVALKLVRPGLAQWRLDARFERERDILGSLEHPHIARLYEAGTTQQGQAFLAMEYVAGRPLTEHADAAGLDVPARLRLFLQVLGAVQHAHQRLVVHRDIKPSNILVDAQGSVRLLDFGIAQLQDERQPQTALTELGQALLTPQYASPEQVAHAPVSTASDLYSLGVVLCALLSGQGPYATTRDTRAALEEAILQGDLRRPSQLAPPARRAALRGDLDTVVGKALQRDPAQRYPSADAFAQDLQRHLAGVPVLAHPDSLGYRARKFTARNRLAVAAGSAVTLALLLGLGLTAWQASLARQQAARATHEAQRALAVQDFLIGVFREADPAHAQGKDQPVREVLARGARLLQSQLAGQPEVQAAVAGALVQINIDLADYAQALPLARSRVETLARLSGGRGPGYARALFDLAQVESGQLRYGVALTWLTQARQALGPPPPGDPALDLDIAQLEAVCLGMLQRPAEAVVVLERILPRLLAQGPADSWPVLKARSVLSFNLARSGQLPLALALQAEIEPLLDRLGPAHGLERASLRAEGGQVLWRAGALDTAALTLQRAIDELDRLQGPRGQVAAALHRDLGLVLLDQGQPAGALAQMQTHAERALALYGERDHRSAVARQASVMPLLWLGRAAEAAALARETLAAFVVDGDADAGRQPELRGMQRQSALAQVLAGEPEAAVRLLEDLSSRELTAKVVGWRRAFTLAYLAGALHAAGQPARAAAVAQQALDLIGDSAVYQARLLAIKAGWTQALALATAGQPAQARQAQRLADAAAMTLLTPEHPLRTLAQVVDAALLRAEGQGAAAQLQDAGARQRLRQAQRIALAQPLMLVF